MDFQDRIAGIFPEAASIPPEHRMDSKLVQREYLIDGEIRVWEGPLQEAPSPVCIKEGGKIVRAETGAYPLLGEKEALDALAAAVKAYDSGRGLWPTMSVEGRIRHVESFLERMLKARAETVKLLMWEIGKSLKDSEKEFDRTADYIRDTIDALKELDRQSSRLAFVDGIFAQIRRAPLGVTLCMGPYNYPLNETFTTLIPALIMGNTAVFKPPKMGVLLHKPLLEAFRDSFPKGVVNTVYGEGRTVVGPMMASGKVDVLAFIGSSGVADVLKQQHPKPHRLRCVLGLEAKNAAIVLDDADLGLAAKECVLGSLSFNGQRCTALKMLFVHKSVLEEFLAKLCAEIESLKFGMPWDGSPFLTPLPEPGKCEYLASLVEDAMKLGAKVVNPGGGVSLATYFHPAVLCPVHPKSRIYREEQFGPVVPIAPFDDISTPLQYIIDSNYGQQASIFGSSPERMAALIDPLVNQVCRVNINSQCQRGPDSFPFTGRKDSAENTLSVSDALRVFTIRTLVAAKGNPENKKLLSAILKGRKSNFLSTDYIL